MAKWEKLAISIVFDHQYKWYNKIKNTIFNFNNN